MPPQLANYLARLETWAAGVAGRNTELRRQLAVVNRRLAAMSGPLDTTTITTLQARARHALSKHGDAAVIHPEVPDSYARAVIEMEVDELQQAWAGDGDVDYELLDVALTTMARWQARRDRDAVDETANRRG